MKQLIADMHMHTLASGHAYGTIREMVQAASDVGLQMIGITEHAPGIPGTVDPFYYANLKAVPREINGVKLMLGSEVNVLQDGTLSLTERTMGYLDYAIVGIHTLCYEDAGIPKNTDNLISCMKHPKVRIVSHPDDDHTPLDYDRLTMAALETHTALEVNNSSLREYWRRENCYDNYTTMLGLCAERGVPIVVNTDAHDPSQVGVFTDAIELLSSLNFPDALILNNDLEKLRTYLTE
ncbi:MAG: phosphatase [Solobacterium sp.]|nr:phosphatase [Solobacterium sp.]